MKNQGMSIDLKLINPNAIHLWVIPLDGTNRPLEDFRSILSNEEKEQWERFSFSDLQRRYAIAHVRMREIISDYIKIKPSDITFTTNVFEKPFLVEANGLSNIYFNLSHSHDIAVLAITQSRKVGVDVERLKPLNDYMKIAGRYFSPGEINALKQMKGRRACQAFIQLWAGKEAFIKAHGEGISLPLNQFSLENLIEHPGKKVCKIKLPGESIPWSVSPLKMPAGYLGAVAIEGEIPDIQYFKE